LKKKIIKAFFERVREGCFTVKFWDGEEVVFGSDPPTVRIIFKKPLPLGFDLEDPVLSFGEAYMDEIFNFEGDLEDIIRMALASQDDLLSGGLGGKIATGALKTINRVAVLVKQKENIQHHYDLGNDFFSLWLDDTMSYSCAYFKTPEDSLYQAQLQKNDLILKKLCLSPGQQLLDIGSGWGWLVIRAAQKYRVKATGITISTEQYLASRERVKTLGLEDLVRIELIDYLEFESKEQFDRIVSVGMYEHVGELKGDNLAFAGIQLSPVACGELKTALRYNSRPLA